MIDPTTARAMLEVDVERIVPNPRQPRRRLASEPLDELARSIAADGLLQPLVVRDLEDGTYELIAGERRWRAARAAGLVRVPVVVRDADERTTLVLALVENLLREDLNAVEVARSYAALTDELGLGVAELAARVGKSRAAVANTLRLLDLPDDALALVEEGTLSEGHGRAILQAPGHDDRRRLARQAARDGLSVRATESLARASGRRRGPRRGPDWLDDDVAVEAAEAAYRALGLPARLVPARGGVRFEVQVRSSAELAALAERLDRIASLAETHVL
jgi:ParB family chromosome partitioning protein